MLSVGTIRGDVFLWDLGARQRIADKGFDVWKLDACSKELQVYFSSFGSSPILSKKQLFILFLFYSWTGIFERGRDGIGKSCGLES